MDILSLQYYHALGADAFIMETEFGLLLPRFILGLYSSITTVWTTGTYQSNVLDQGIQQ